MKRYELSKITCIADARLSETIVAEADRLGVPELNAARAKQVSLREGNRPLPLHRAASAAEDRAEAFFFYVPRGAECPAMTRLGDAAELDVPGRGSVFAEDVVLLAADDRPAPAAPPPDDAASCRPAADYDFIRCIVQRGKGDELARTMLELGLCVPAVSYGEGMGLRDKLGLLRITVPQAKEVLWFLAPASDADLVMDAAARNAGLDRPGRGFIFRSPVRAEVVNTSIYRGSRRHLASMEQVINALDSLRGSTDWRRLSAGDRRPSRRKAERPPLAAVSIVCEDGAAAPLVQAAMSAGAGGATLVRLTRRDSAKPTAGTLESHALETCDLVVARDAVDPIVAALEGAGLFAPGSRGFAEVSAVTSAATYAGG